MSLSSSWWRTPLGGTPDQNPAPDTPDPPPPTDAAPKRGFYAESPYPPCCVRVVSCNIVKNNVFFPGETSLKCVYNFLMRNSEWIEGQLDVPLLIGSTPEMSNQPESHFSLNIDPLPESTFNPLHEFRHISDCKFDHVSAPCLGIRQWTKLLCCKFSRQKIFVWIKNRTIALT